MESLEKQEHTKQEQQEGTIFVSEVFKDFCEQFGIKHINFSVREHREIGKLNDYSER